MRAAFRHEPQQAELLKPDVFCNRADLSQITIFSNGRCPLPSHWSRPAITYVARGQWEQFVLQPNNATRGYSSTFNFFFFWQTGYIDKDLCAQQPYSSLFACRLLRSNPKRLRHLSRRYFGSKQRKRWVQEKNRQKRQAHNLWRKNPCAGPLEPNPILEARQANDPTVIRQLFQDPCKYMGITTFFSLFLSIGPGKELPGVNFHRHTSVILLTHFSRGYDDDNMNA